MTKSGRHEHRNEERHVGGSDNRCIDPGQLIRRRLWNAALRGGTLSLRLRRSDCPRRLLSVFPKGRYRQLIAHLNGFILE